MKHASWWMAALVAVVTVSCVQADRVADAAGNTATRAGEQGMEMGSSQHTGLAAAAGEGERVLSVDATRRSYESGDHRWTPVEFREDQALAAIKRGELVIPMPDGPPLVLGYSRHVEHDDGNWTFIGKGAKGEDAVITFGADAVFGSISTRSGTVRLTTDSRGGWLVRSPPGADADPAGRSDLLVPPQFSTVAALAPRLARGHGIARVLGKEVALLADATTVVDVVVGFTNGISTARGGESVVRTRVNNLVEITNQAYANSGLPARLRLAHALSVDFPDATENSDALSKLTGYKSGTGPVPVDPALQALRSAREQYHGDLVVLLRNFQTPENGGCGIAWLLGGGFSGISASDDAFAFSVVADGTDVDSTDGKTYFCREETFAHELGHSMGQTHNVEDSGSPGAHPYSYGYRQAATNGFYTVMSYRLKESTQFGIRHFSNPAIAYNGAPTGVADTADNVRSMFQTMPLIANFRIAPTAPPAPAPTRWVVNDLDGDGMSDMVWQGPASGYFETWRMESQRLARALGFQLPAGNRVMTAGDFNGDRKLDLLVKTDTNNLMYYMGNGTTFSVQPMVPKALPGWGVIGSTDVDGDGNQDLVWTHPDSNYFEVWLMQGAAVKAIRPHVLPSDTRLVTTGDFAGDGKADVLVMNAARELTLWLGDGTGFTAQRLSITNPVAPGWMAWGDVDMNNDGRADLMWSTPATSYFEWWNMQGAQVQRASGATPPADQRVAGTGDFNGDGLADVLLKGLGNDLHVGVSDGVLFNRTPLNIVAGPGWLPLVPGQP